MGTAASVLTKATHTLAQFFHITVVDLCNGIHYCQMSFDFVETQSVSSSEVLSVNICIYLYETCYYSSFHI